ERVAFIHEKYNSDAIAEEYIEGRELYVSLMGNVRLTVFPIREMVFREVPPDEPKIATYKAKWDEEYRKRWGLENHFAEDIDPALVTKTQEICKTSIVCSPSTVMHASICASRRRTNSISLRPIRI